MRSVVSVLIAVCGLSALGCRNLKDFKGRWDGDIQPASTIRAGFDEETRLTLTITSLNSRILKGSISTCVKSSSTDECVSGMFQDAELLPLEKAQNDSLQSITFGGEPYAVYLLTAQPVDLNEFPVLAIISLHAQDRVEVRLVRVNDLYGVFRLEKL